MANGSRAKFRTEVRKLARRYGWDVVRHPAGHLRIVRDGYEPITCSHSPSDGNAIHAIERDLRRRDREGPMRARTG